MDIGIAIGLISSLSLNVTFAIWLVIYKVKARNWEITKKDWKEHSKERGYHVQKLMRENRALQNELDSVYASIRP